MAGNGDAGAWAALIGQYQEGLQELTFNSKPIITNLTIIAGEIATAHGPVAAASVAAAVEKHIHTTKPEFKLPALYLLDSIAKNLRAQYAAVLEPHVAELYTVVWEALPQQRRSLEHLRATWRTVFPSAYVALEHHFAAAAVQQAPQVMMGWMPGGAAAPPWAPPQAVPPLGGPPSWGPQHAPPPPPHMVPLTSSSSWYPEQAVAAAPVMPPMVYGQHVASVIPSAPHTAPPHMLAHPMYGQPATHGDGSALLVPAMPVGHGGAADGAWAPPTLGALMPPSLATLLADLAHSVAAPGTAAPLAPSSGHDAPAAAAPATPETRLEFDAQAMRGAANQRAIAAMYGDQPLQCPTTGRRFRDAVSYAAHLEVQALQQRKEQEGKQLSRRWFVPFDTWASGAAAVGADPDAAGAFFDEQEAAAAAKAAEAAKAAALSLPVDESQPRCALTGELFETFWHAELEEWHYRGAVRLDKPTGGVPAGRLVLAKAVPTLQGDAAKALLDSHAVALDLAAAAAAAGAEEMLPPPYAADAQPARERGGDGEATSGGGVDGEPADEHGAKRQRTGE